MDADQLQPGGSGPKRAEDDGRGGRAQGRSAAHQRDGDAVEAVPGAEDTRILVLGSKNEQRAAKAGQGAGEGHALADAAVRGNSAGAGRFAAGSDGSPLEAAPGARQEPPDAGSGEQRERESEIEPTSEEESRQPGGCGDRLGPGDAYRGSRSGSAEGPGNQPSLHEMNGDPVEQDGADHLVDATAHLEPPGQQSPKRAGEARGGEAKDHRSRDVDLPDHRGRERAPDELTLSADVEQPDGEGDRHRKAGEDQDGGFDGGLAYGTDASEGARDQVGEAGDRIPSGSGDGEKADQKRDEERGDRAPEGVARRREEPAAELRQPPAPDPTSSGRAARRWHLALPRR